MKFGVENVGYWRVSQGSSVLASAASWLPWDAPLYPAVLWRNRRKTEGGLVDTIQIIAVLAFGVACFLLGAAIGPGRH